MPLALSICIPTHDGRAANLKNALNSVITQLDANIRDKIEICISDNASTDNTKELVEEYKKLHPHLVYFRHDKNMGADANFIKAVEISNGKYCWLLGSDDIIIKGAFNIIMPQLAKGHDIYMFNRSDYDSDMNFILTPPFLFDKGIKQKVFNFNGCSDIDSYFRSLRSVNAAFGFLSSQVFLRKSWDSIAFDKDFIGTAYSMAFVLLSILKTKASVKYLNDILIITITDQDVWSEYGLRKRILIDISGYKMLLDRIFGGCIDTKYYLKRLLSLNYVFGRLLYIVSVEKEGKLIKNDFIEIAGFSKAYFFFISILKYPYLFLRKVKYLLLRKKGVKG